MVAGPWFTVVENGSGFTDFGQVWLSDGGTEDGVATLQLSLRLIDPENSDAM
jgi:hypothetical protein